MFSKIFKYIPGYKEMIPGFVIMSIGLMPLAGIERIAFDFGDKIVWGTIKPLPEGVCLVLIYLGFGVVCVNGNLARLIRIQIKRAFRFYKNRLK